MWKTPVLRDQVMSNVTIVASRLSLTLFVPIENFSLIWRRHYYRRRASNYYLYTWNSWPLSSEGSLACNTFCDTGHTLIMGVTLVPISERLAVELSLPVFIERNMNENLSIYLSIYLSFFLFVFWNGIYSIFIRLTIGVGALKIGTKALFVSLY